MATWRDAALAALRDAAREHTRIQAEVGEPPLAAPGDLLHQRWEATTRRLVEARAQARAAGATEEEIERAERPPAAPP